MAHAASSKHKRDSPFRSKFDIPFRHEFARYSKKIAHALVAAKHSSTSATNTASNCTSDNDYFFRRDGTRAGLEPDDSGNRQSLLFETNVKPLRQAVEFYKHTENWSNRLVAGDSLLVMNSLLEKEAMAGKVLMVYFDPPYGVRPMYIA